MNTEKAGDIKLFLTGLAASLTALWGYLGWAIVFLVLAMAADYITGSFAARAHGEWSSAVARAPPSYTRSGYSPSAFSYTRPQWSDMARATS